MKETPWRLMFLTAVAAIILFALNEIFANGSTAATNIINWGVIFMVIVSVVRSFDKTYSMRYRVRFLLFVAILIAFFVCLASYNRYRIKKVQNSENPMSVNYMKSTNRSAREPSVGILKGWAAESDLTDRIERAKQREVTVS